MSLKQFLCLLVLLSAKGNFPLQPFSVSILEEEDLAELRLIDGTLSENSADAVVCKVSNKDTLYILKQIKDEEDQFSLIRDTIGSEIGTLAHIPINKVYLIPFNVGGSLKIYPGRAATLHQLVPGKDLQSDNSTLPLQFTLQQKVRTLWQTHVMEYQQGLTQAVIESMAHNAALPNICALDTFIGNADRSLPNIFYDLKSTTFYGIDQAAAFAKRPLCLLAYTRIKELHAADYFKSCSQEVIDALDTYKNQLIELQKILTPERLLQTMIFLAPYIDCRETDFSGYSVLMKKNHAHLDLLIDLIDKIVMGTTSRSGVGRC